MSILDHPDAHALRADAGVTPEQVRGCQDRLTAFLHRSLPHFSRGEPRTQATRVIRGLVRGLEPKTGEPIAVEAGVHRTPIQFFVGAGKWDDEAVRAEVRRHLRETRGEEQGILVLDPSGVPKSGSESCGVARQWCGRRGKQDTCQLGVVLISAAPGGSAPRDRRLSLPKDWANDLARRTKTPVPPDVTVQESWRIAVDLLQRCRQEWPHAWVTGDDQLGRPAAFRAWLRRHGERDILDVPCTTRIRDLECRRPRRRQAGRGRKRETPFCRAEAGATRPPEQRWTRRTVRDGERGPLQVEALRVRGRSKQERRVGPEERLVVMRTVEAQPQTHSARSNAEADVSRAELVRVRFRRPRIEEAFEAGQGEAGLDPSEVRSGVGWHHHLTLSQRALGLLILERLRMGGKTPGGDGVAGAGNLQASAAGTGPELRTDCSDCDAGAEAERGGANRQVAQGHGEVPAPPFAIGHELNSCLAA